MKIFVATGPESSGKTTIANALSEQLKAPLVGEASRDYLLSLYARNNNSAYQEHDLLQIAQQQISLEQQALKKHPDTIICDTDLLVIIIWSQVRFGRCAQALVELFHASLNSSPRHYFLCDPELAWEPDPLRENPLDRDKLFKLYKEKLLEFKLPFTHLHGNKAERLATALHASVN